MLRWRQRRGFWGDAVSTQADPTGWQRLWQAMPRFFLPPAILVALHGVISLGFQGYERLPSIDIPMHFAGGVVITLSGAVLLRVALEAGLLRDLNRILAAVLLVCFATTAAVAWEFAEFLADHYFAAGAQGSIADTMGDLLLGMAGALLAATWAARRLPGDPTPDGATR